MTSRTAIVSAMLAVIIFFAVNVAGNHFLRTVRVDLTEHSLYSLSEGSRKVLASLTEPIYLRLYLSRSEIPGVPGLVSFAAHVEDLLREFERSSNNMITLEIIEPESFSEEEDRAVAYGLEGFQVAGSESPAYFGLVGTNTLDGQQTIPFIAPEREPLLEYDLTRMIHRLSNLERSVVGIASSIPVQGLGEGSQMLGASAEPWVFYRQLSEVFDVRLLRLSEDAIPDDLDLLVLINPRNLTSDVVYEIDQYVLRGNNLLLLTDAHSEVIAALLRNVTTQQDTNTASNLNKLARQWGVTQVEDKIVADITVAANILDPQGTANQTVDYPIWMNVQPGQLNRTEAVTAQLGNIIFASSGALTIEQKPDLAVTPLIVTSPAAMLYDYEVGSQIDNLRGLLSQYQPEGQQYVLAARVSGIASTAFPDGRPQSADGEGAVNSSSHEHMSSGEINVIIFADSDFLQDHFWVRKQPVLGSTITFAEASNGELIHNAVDYLAGNSDLIGVRSRGSYFRNFEYLQQLRRNAELEFASHEQQLQTELKTVEQILRSYESGQSNQQSEIILTDAQREELNRVRENQIRIRKELREVQRSLRSDIEKVELITVVLNVVVVPLLVAIVGFIVVAFGTRRRNRKLAAYLQTAAQQD